MSAPCPLPQLDTQNVLDRTPEERAAARKALKQGSAQGGRIASLLSAVFDVDRDPGDDLRHAAASGGTSGRDGARQGWMHQASGRATGRGDGAPCAPLPVPRSSLLSLQHPCYPFSFFVCPWCQGGAPTGQPSGHC